MPGPVRTHRAAGLGLTPDDVFGAVSRLHRAEAASGPATPRRGDQPEPSYYDVSILKAPVWKWEIAAYFFFGGVSAGSYLLARLAERFGGEAYRGVTRAGTAVAFVTLLPCPPLLIKDLGDPKRFHHMLRVWKPSTPMNLGTWTLVAYSGAATVGLLREYLRGRCAGDGEQRPLTRAAGQTFLAIHDAAGVPLAILLAGYTGVLVSSTANPLWAKNSWIGPIFSASSVATGAEAISLTLEATGTGTDRQHRALKRIATVAGAVESASLGGYLVRCGEKARPLTTGSQKGVFWFSVASLGAAEVLRNVPAGKRAKPWLRGASAVLDLAAGFALRWAMVHGGQEAAEDPHLARRATGTPRRRGRDNADA